MGRSLAADLGDCNTPARHGWRSDELFTTFDASQTVPCSATNVQGAVEHLGRPVE